MSKKLGWEGAKPLISRNFYNSLVQVTLLFGGETWVMSPRIGSNLGKFYHSVSLRLTNIQHRRDTTVGWDVLPLDEEMTVIGLEEVDNYVLPRHNTLTQYIYTRLILELYLEVD